MRHQISFTHAWDGMVHTFRTQPNLRLHLAATLLVLIAAYLLAVTTIEWLILLFTIMWVITAEMINTAMESIVDLITLEKRTSAKIAKDVSAGMVLVSAIGSVVVGLVIFIPYLLK